MEELNRILQACEAEGHACVIAAVVEVNGSAYRREGARCIILEHGEVKGILSGGCIEEDLKGHAAEVFATGVSRRLYYDFRAGEDDVWGLGVGCNGAVGVWMELYDPVRFPEEARRIAEDYSRRLASRYPYEAATVLSSSNPQVHPPGERWTAPAGQYAGRLGAGPAGQMGQTSSTGPTGQTSSTGTAGFAGQIGQLGSDGATDPDRRTGQTGSTGTAGFRGKPGQAGRMAGIVWELRDGAELEVLVERIRPVPELVIVGVGEDARVLCGMAKLLGWRVGILYHLTDKVSKQRFPEADNLIIVHRLAFEQADVAGKYVVVMTHNLELDREAVRKLLKADTAYLGLVGSKYRLEQILAYIRAEEPAFDETLLGKLYSPVGLDIGAETPQEIALSIMAEAQACRSGLSGGFLRNRKGLGSKPNADQSAAGAKSGDGANPGNSATSSNNASSSASKNPSSSANSNNSADFSNSTHFSESTIPDVGASSSVSANLSISTKFACSIEVKPAAAEWPAAAGNKRAPLAPVSAPASAAPGLTDSEGRHV